MRNWIEEALGKQIAWRPCCIGYRGGRKLYVVTFEDGTEDTYFIDFDKQEIEAY